MDNVVLDEMPYSLDRYPFMSGLHVAEDFDREVVVKKSAQCGGTMAAVIGCLYQADRGLKVIYYTPTDVSVRNVVHEKVNPIIAGSPYLRSRTYDLKIKGGGSVQNIHQKRVGTGLFYARGAKSRMARQSTPADKVVLDERDDWPDEWIPDVRKRMNDSQHKLISHYGVPLFVGSPIDAAYTRSDQRVYAQRCSRCGQWWDLDFFRDVVVETGQQEYELQDRKWTKDCGRDIYVYCPACHQPRNRVGKGAWISRFPGRRVAGFHINRLMTLSVTMAELWEILDEALRSGDPSEIQGFYGGDLGLGYTPASSALSGDALDACRRNYRMPEKLQAKDVICTAGFDVQGDYLVGRVSQILRKEGTRIRRAVWIGRCTWDTLGEIFERFRIRVAVMDGIFDPTKGKEARDRYKPLWLGFYPSRDNPKREMLVTDKDTKRVDIQRTHSMNRSHSEVMTEHNQIPRTARMIPHFYEEMKAAVRIQEKDAHGIPRSVWRKAGADDYRHADNYDYVAAELLDQGTTPAPGTVYEESKRAAAMAKIKKPGRKDVSDADLVAALEGRKPKD